MQLAYGNVQVKWCALMQVALIVGSGIPTASVLVLIWLVVITVVSCCCTTPTCPDADPDLCTLRWWCFLLISLHKYSTCTRGGQHLLQRALVVLFFSSAWSNSYSTCTYDGHLPLQLVLVVFCLPATGENTPLASTTH